MIELEFNLVSIHEARRSLEMSEISNQMAKDSNQMAKDSNEMARRSLEMSEISNQMAKDSNQMAKDSNEMARISIEMSELSNKMAKDSNEMTRKSVEMSELSIKMSKHSNSLSLSMKRLSWITFIFLPLTFVSGLFGMNLDILANNPSWTWYFVIAGSVLALVFVVWIIFKYLPISDWIEKNIGDRLESSFTTGQAESTPESAGLISPPGVSSSDEITPSRSLLSLRRRLIPVRENNRAHDTEKGTMATGASEQVTNLDSDSNLV
ncbi:cora-like Mg2+ transporter protein-domain-containing protein [Morchella snyderi]|nr:cora-like Mg2+ transporter protein-domain-containing protein [Morchella snyderi]